MHSRSDILREAASTGFQPEPFEKAVRLLETLEALVSHPFLSGRLVLKGGTALNLFVFDMPRLSVDIDLNYIGAADRETMLADKPKVDQAVHAVCARQLLSHPELDLRRLRVGFVVYGGANRRDWRSIALDDLQADPVEIERQLLPMLRGDLIPARGRLVKWSDGLVADCRRMLALLLPLSAAESRFLTLLNDSGIIAPDLLTDDPTLQQIIRTHPALNWKARNVQDHKGGDVGAAS